MSRFDRVLLFVVGVLLFAPGISSRDLWNPDEPRYAQVAREMLETGQLLVPHLNGKVYAEKPPLHFWLIALFGWLRGGVDEVAARLPSLVAGVLSLFVLFEMARLLGGTRVAWWTALVFGSTGKILWQARVGQIDMGLIFWVSLGMLAVVRAVRQSAERPAWGFWIATAFGTLAKGPAALLPPLLGLALWSWQDRSLRIWQKLRPGRGLLVWVAIVLAWLGPAALVGGSDYFATLLFKQNLERYADPWHHHQPWYYYLKVLPGDFFPWSFFLPGAILLLWRRSTGLERQGFRFALAWSAATLVFFSVSPAKRTVYILTMYPALALLIALAFDEVAREGKRLRNWLLWPAALLAAGTTFGAVALAWMLLRPGPAVRSRLYELEFLGPGWHLLVLLFAIGLSAGALGALLAALRHRPGQLLLTLASTLGTLATTVAVAFLPRFDPVKSPRELAGIFSREAEPTDVYGIWPRLDANVVFSCRRFAAELPSEEILRTWALEPGRRWLFAKRNAWQKLDPPLTGFREVARDSDTREGYLLLVRDNPPRLASDDSP